MANQLPSWTDGQAKAQVLEFVRSATEPGASFVPAPERVAAFDNDVCSAGGRDFVRVVAEEMYGIPRQNVIGSGTTLECRHGQVYRTKGIEQPVDDGLGKPVHVWARTGRKPLLAGGNADGDAAMLRTARFGLLVRHHDAGRKFAYLTGAEKTLAKAKDAAGPS